MGMEEAAKRFFGSLEDEVRLKINERVDKEVEDLNKAIASVEEQARTNCAHLAVKVGERTGIVEGTRHKQLDRLVTLVANGLSVMLVGMAGTGKTHAAQQVAEALGREFYAMSVGAQTSKSDIIGYMHAGGDYVDTMFRRAYEHGGVFLMDEIDAGNANVLIQVNAALANQYCAFPDQMVKRHDNFVFIGSANTYGTGANRQYVGRNQLDAATLDRFAILEWQIDVDLEKSMAGTQAQGLKWQRAMAELRGFVSDEGMRVLVTPRATDRGARLLAAEVPLDEVIDYSILGMFPADKKDRVRTLIKDSMRKHLGEDYYRVPEKGKINAELLDRLEQHKRNVIAEEMAHGKKKFGPGNPFGWK